MADSDPDNNDFGALSQQVIHHKKQSEGVGSMCIDIFGDTILTKLSRFRHGHSVLFKRLKRYKNTRLFFRNKRVFCNIRPYSLLLCL